MLFKKKKKTIIEAHFPPKPVTYPATEAVAPRG